MLEGRELVGVALDGKYLVEALADEGGMGWVYDARRLDNGKRVAVKVLRLHQASDPRSVARFAREARILRSLKNERIATIDDAGTTVQGVPYIVMEYLDGKSLRTLITEEAPLSPERATNLVIQALAALESAHQAHVVHRDIKPQNLFLIEDDAGRDFVKLLDFGVSKLRSSDDGGSHSLTETGHFLGTPSYVAPEQALGKSVTTRSDIYSMGVVLYELVTGKLPFQAANHNALMIKVLIEAIRDPREINAEIPVELSDVIQTAMARQPLRRFESADAFRRKLLPFARSNPAATPEATALPDLHPASGSESATRVHGIHDVIFVCLYPSEGDVILPNGDVMRVISLDELGQLPQALEKCSPRAVVSTMTIDIEALREDCPTFHAPLILVDVCDPSEELSIHEWSEASGGYVLRHAPLTDMDRIIGEICARFASTASRKRISVSPAQSLFEISFHHSVEAGGSSFQIETEIQDDGETKVVTRVWRDGVVIDLQTQEIESFKDELQWVEMTAEMQHNAAIQDILSGGDR